MPTGLKQPVGQKRLTNVAVVRMRKAGAVFEIACYKNKVSNWRAEIETDLDEVLQTTAVFSNVSKGIIAKEKQLEKAFGTTDEKKICLEILAKGDLQVSDKERKLEYDNLYKDVASIIAEKCIDPKTNRQYTATIIERALKDVHFNPDLKKNAKQQALSEALPLLQKRFSIQRANMRVQIRVPSKYKKESETLIQERKYELESMAPDADMDGVSFVCLIEPGMYRALHRGIEEITQGTGRIELIHLTAISETPHAYSFQDNPNEEEHETETKSKEKSSISLQKDASAEKNVIYARGPISGLQEDFARKEMFMELDRLEEGWEIELLQSPESEIIHATFYSPTGEEVGAFAKARRKALVSSKRE